MKKVVGITDEVWQHKAVGSYELVEKKPHGKDTTSALVVLGRC